MMKTFVLVLSLLFVCSIAIGQEQKEVVINKNTFTNATLLYADDFEKGLENWQEQLEVGGGKVELNKGKMEILTQRGCTVWFTKQLKAPVMIEYDATMIAKGGVLDRVSDLNCFFMAIDPNDPTSKFINKKGLSGALGDYNKLKLYYVGQGGRKNTTVRFRRYPGTGERPMLPEHDLSNKEFLLSGNVVNHVKIVVYHNYIQYYRNNQLIFDFYDSEPLTTGYFGFRTTINHVTLDNFKVYSLHH